MIEVQATRPGCEICEIVPKLDPDFHLIEGEYWLANLRDRDQSLLGTSFITLKQHVPELDQLSDEQETELVMIRNGLLRALRQTFQPITFNISCLKNDAFKADPDNTPPEASHVHWHVRPRYSSAAINFAGLAFEDPLPGRYLSIYERKPVPKEVALQIAGAIRANL